MPNEKYFSNDLLNAMSPGQIKKYQEEKLRSQLKYCYYNSPFYKKKFDEFGAHPNDIKTIEDLRALPIFMNKEQERQNASESLEKENHPFGTHL